MSFLSVVSKGFQAMVEEATKPKSFKVGESFENYARECLFIESYYDLLERTHDYSNNQRDFVRSSLKPDFMFYDNWTRREFYVEAKFKSSFYEGKITWCNEKQLTRYQEYNKRVPVFLLLGIGEEPTSPEVISLIPLSVAKHTGLFPSVINKYEIGLERPVASKVLWNR